MSNRVSKITKKTAKVMTKADRIGVPSGVPGRKNVEPVPRSTTTQAADPSKRIRRLAPGAATSPALNTPPPSAVNLKVRLK